VQPGYSASFYAPTGPDFGTGSTFRPKGKAAKRFHPYRQRTARPIISLILDIIFSTESFHAPFGINELLLAGEERVASGADIQMHFLFCGACLYLVSARTGHGHIVVFRMNFFSQLSHLRNKYGGFYRLVSCDYSMDSFFFQRRCRYFLVLLADPAEKGMGRPQEKSLL
jgi:hypothetical protein